MNNYRIPNGAIPEGDSVTFIIHCSFGDNVKLHLIEDSTDKEVEVEMKLINGHYSKTTFLSKGLYWYYFKCEEKTTETFQLNIYDRNYEVPSWMANGIIYHVFIDRFCRKGKIRHKDNSILRYDWDDGIPITTLDGVTWKCNDFFGGNLLGLISKLNYLHELGVTCIYLSPIFEADSNHRYDTNDHSKIDKMVGNTLELRILCKLAKRKGINIILDIAFNHVGSSSKYFNDSKYDEWFTRYEDGSYDCWWGFPTLPSIKKDTPDSYKDHVEKVLLKWLRCGVKGFRLDVADELSNDLLIHIRNVVKSYDKDAVIYGEVWEDMSNKTAYGERKNYLEGNKLDSGMNYPFRNAILDFVKHGDDEQLRKTIDAIKTNYPIQSQVALMNMLSSHDVERLITNLDGDLKRLELAVLLQFTLQGTPCIYYGDEIGMTGRKDPYNRRPMQWNNIDEKTLQIYRNMIQLRSSSKALQIGDIVVKDSPKGTICFVRSYDVTYVEVFVDANNLTYEVTVK